MAAWGYEFYLLVLKVSLHYLKHKHVKEFSGRDRLLSSWIINEFLKRVRKPIAFKETLRPVNAV